MRYISETALRGIIRNAILNEAYGDGRYKMKNVAFDDMRDDYGEFDDQVYHFDDNNLVDDRDQRAFDSARQNLQRYHKIHNNQISDDYLNDRSAENGGISDYRAFKNDQNEKRHRFNDSKPNMLAFDDFHDELNHSQGDVGEFSADSLELGNPYDDGYDTIYDDEEF